MNHNRFYFYVLECKDFTFYGGYTTEPERRLKEHNKGVGAKYTRARHRRPASLIYLEQFATKSEAMKAEYAFKKLSRKQKELFLQRHKDKNLQIIDDKKTETKKV